MMTECVMVRCRVPASRDRLRAKFARREGRARILGGGRGCSGFTLIEMMVAMVLLGIGVLGIAGLGVAAIRSVGFAERSTRAALVAQEYMDRAVQALHDNDPVRLVNCTNQQVRGGEYLLTRTITISATPTLTPHLIVVSVTPPTRNSTPVPYTMRSYVYETRVNTPATSGSC